MADFDLIIKNGTVVDPSQGLNGRKDIAIINGQVAYVSDDIESKRAKEMVDVSGKVVTPGLVDMHTHTAWGISYLGLDPDLWCLVKGTTTAMDAGSTGAQNFRGFRKHIIERCRTRVVAFLHVSQIGMTTGVKLDEELADLRNVDVDEAVKVAQENDDVIRGLKIRFDVGAGENWPEALRRAKEASKATGLPLMVHKGIRRLDEVLPALEKGDILTHCYFRQDPLVDERGVVHPEVERALKRGVLLDVGHGRGGLNFDVARRCLDKGILPTTMGSDLHTVNNNGPVFDLPSVMSKFLALGLSLPTVVKLCTENPASALGMDDEVGTLKPGACGDVTVFDLVEGEFTLWDSNRNSIIGRQLLRPVLVVRGGEVVYNALGGDRLFRHYFLEEGYPRPYFPE